MDNPSKDYIIDYFSKRFLHFKDNPAAVGWTPSGQKLRYEVITKLLNLERSSILDFGCGKGDLYGFLKERGLEVKYAGVDINPELINFASKKYPGINFYTIDIEKENLPDNFDYIIICGVFNLRVEGVKESAYRTLKKLFNHTKRSLLFNCPSIYTGKKDMDIYYYDPCELLGIALGSTKNVNLYHGLIEGEIFLILSREVQ